MHGLYIGFIVASHATQSERQVPYNIFVFDNKKI